MTKNPDGSVTLGPKPFTLSGVDGAFAVSLAPTTGKTQPPPAIGEPKVKGDVELSADLTGSARSQARGDREGDGRIDTDAELHVTAGGKDGNVKGANSPRPELAVQITKTVSARLGYELGVPAPGENPDRTELTLDWRFFRNWSLVAVVGDQGSTALDVLWRMRC